MRLVVDCDPGNGVPFSDVDDGLALALALAHPDVRLEAVTIVAGNTPRDVGYTSAVELLKAARSDVAVFAGSPAPLDGDDARWRAILDGRRDRETWRSRFGASTELPSVDAPPVGGAVEKLVALVDAHPGDVTIAALGPLTNVALALELDPGFARNVAHIAIMGGAFGEDRMPQELNFGYDPEAAHRVLTSGANISLVPFDVTSRTRLTREHLGRLDPTDPLQAFIRDTTAPWLEYADSRFKTGGCYLHDPLVIAGLIDPTLIGWSDVAVDVVTADSVARGRPIRWDPDGLILGGGSLTLPDVPTVRVAESVDAERFAELLVETLCSYRV